MYLTSMSGILLPCTLKAIVDNGGVICSVHYSGPGCVSRSFHSTADLGTTIENWVASSQHLCLSQPSSSGTGSVRPAYLAIPQVLGCVVNSECSIFKST